MGTGLFVGVFIPFITGDSLVFAAGLVSADPRSGVNIFVIAVGIGLAAWFGDQTGYAIGLRLGRPYL
ncbi:MAG: DedA family protein, partial [Actinomycetes bacterium]